PAAFGHLACLLALHRITAKRPMKWVTFFLVPCPDEGHDLLPQRFNGGKIAPLQAAFMQNRKEQFDLIHPGSVQGRIMEFESVAVLAVERRPPLRETFVMDIQVVPNDDDTFPGI